MPRRHPHHGKTDALAGIGERRRRKLGAHPTRRAAARALDASGEVDAARRFLCRMGFDRRAVDAAIVELYRCQLIDRGDQ